MAGDSQIIVFFVFLLVLLVLLGFVGSFVFLVLLAFLVLLGFLVLLFFWFFWFCLLFGVLRLGLRGLCCQRRFERVKHGKCALPGTPVLYIYVDRESNGTPLNPKKRSKRNNNKLSTTPPATARAAAGSLQS